MSSSLPTAPAPPPADSSGASWPVPRRGPRGCQARRAPARPPCTKRLCGDWLGARQRVENLVSTERGGEHRAAPPPPPGPRRLPQPAPTQSRRLYTPFRPYTFISPRPHPALHLCAALPIPRGPPPHTSSLPPPAPLSLTHPDAIFSPPSLLSRASPILGSFPRQPWPSPTPPGVGGWVCMWREGEGSWGHRGGELRREAGLESRVGSRGRPAGARCLPGSINGAREFRACPLVPRSVSIPGCLPQASGQA